MTMYNVEHVYGCGSTGNLEIEADNAEHARQIAREDFSLEGSDILDVTEIVEAQAA